MSLKSKILDDKAISRAITRIAYEIIERNKGVEDLILIGIKTRGYPLAERLSNRIREIENVDIPFYPLDITFYRDDLSLVEENPIVEENISIENINDKKVVLVDDVIYTGRTIRAALDALIHIGRPSKVQLAVLIDRGHRELPIRADYVGKNTPTSKFENIKVNLEEIDGKDEINIIKRKN